jgi:hypothetical protein
MIKSLEQKIVLVTPPGAIVDAASLTTGSIDTKGYDWLDVFVIIGATDIAMTALKIQYSDTDGSYGDVPNGNFATGLLPDGAAAALPAASGATGDNTVHAWHGPTRKRFYDVVATGGDGTAGAYIMVVAILSRPKESPNTTAERGLAQELHI